MHRTSKEHMAPHKWSWWTLTPICPTHNKSHSWVLATPPVKDYTKYIFSVTYDHRFLATWARKCINKRVYEFLGNY